MVPYRRSSSANIGAIVFAFLLCWAGLASAAGNTKKVRVTYTGWGIGAAIAYVGIDANL